MTGAYSLVIVCEAVADHRVASVLADRVLCAEVEWIDPETLNLHRRWQGVDAGSSHIEWHRVRSLAKRHGFKVWGKFSGEPGAPDARAARLVLQLLLATDNLPDAVLLIRDSDGDEERRMGLEQARAERHWPFSIAIGLAHVNRECWVLAGRRRQDREETCWTDCDLEVLRARGAETGLADYLDEVRTRIVPLFADPAR